MITAGGRYLGIVAAREIILVSAQIRKECPYTLIQTTVHDGTARQMTGMHVQYHHRPE